jgi:hypothetical protein
MAQTNIDLFNYGGNLAMNQGSNNQRWEMTLIWFAQFPYFGDGGSVGHVGDFDFPSGDVLVSQGPANGLP